MAHPLVAVLVALMAWWVSTGTILLAIRRADRAGQGAFVQTVIWGVPFLIFGIVAVAQSVTALTVANLYLGFAGALSIWGWIELAFLSGVITGPSRKPQDPHATGGERFLQAWGVIAYHEALLFIAFIGLIAASVGAVNPIAVWTFGTLFVARIFAKLNLFNGVPGINFEAVPSPLAHIPSYFRMADPSWVFPVSISCLTLFTAIWVERILNAGSAEASVMFGLLAALTALALLEHWMMLLPLADTKLWRWMMPDKPLPVATAAKT